MMRRIVEKSSTMRKRRSVPMGTPVQWRRARPSRGSASFSWSGPRRPVLARLGRGRGVIVTVEVVLVLDLRPAQDPVGRLARHHHDRDATIHGIEWILRIEELGGPESLHPDDLLLAHAARDQLAARRVGALARELPV